ncbi:MAG: type II toxin-antitoxin system HicB family antitoxin [Dehalococcoidia bacterium]|nr:type II toxin-antitoxin system HicB family antitoxin [Dehalococcoidia bacterium]
MLDYKGYRGTAEFDVEVGLLHGEVLGTRDVITFQAKAGRALVQAFRDSVDDYLAFCADLGEQPQRGSVSELD